MVTGYSVEYLTAMRDAIVFRVQSGKKYSAGTARFWRAELEMWIDGREVSREQIDLMAEITVLLMLNAGEEDG